MTRAAAQPTFDPDGAPVSVLLDFDGTISLDDTGDTLLARLFEDAELTRHMDDLYMSGEKGSRELIAWDMEVLPRDAEVLLREIDSLALDETLTELLAAVREAGAAAEIVSDGMGFHIERMLAGLGVTDLPVATNDSEEGRALACHDEEVILWIQTIKKLTELMYWAHRELISTSPKIPPYFFPGVTERVSFSSVTSMYVFSFIGVSILPRQTALSRSR